MQRASKWNTHSPYLHLETLRVQKLLSGNSYYKTQTILGNTGVEESCRKNPVSLSVRSRSHECDSTIRCQKSGFVT